MPVAFRKAGALTNARHAERYFQQKIIFGRVPPGPPSINIKKDFIILFLI